MSSADSRSGEGKAADGETGDSAGDSTGDLVEEVDLGAYAVIQDWWIRGWLMAGMLTAIGGTDGIEAKLAVEGVALGAKARVGGRLTVWTRSVQNGVAPTSGWPCAGVLKLGATALACSDGLKELGWVGVPGTLGVLRASDCVSAYVSGGVALLVGAGIVGVGVGAGSLDTEVDGWRVGGVRVEGDGRGRGRPGGVCAGERRKEG
eukprot:4479948-Pleurochrysis_carterae.AAC.2